MKSSCRVRAWRVSLPHPLPASRYPQSPKAGWEFNCAQIAFEWEGLLLDADPYNITIANIILPKRVQARQLWITLDTLKVVHDYAANRDLGILSIDVDGNDYWFLQNLIALRPAIIIVEHNAALGRLPITVPYDPGFNRRKTNMAYYGASLSALTYLAEKNGYRLIEVGKNGINAFFVRSDLLKQGDCPLSADDAVPEAPSVYWEQISHLPFVDVTKG